MLFSLINNFYPERLKSQARFTSAHLLINVQNICIHAKNNIVSRKLYYLIFKRQSEIDDMY